MSSNDTEIFKSWGHTLSQARISQGRDSGTLARELMLSLAQLKGIEAGDTRAFHAQSYYLRGVQRYAQYLNIALEPTVESLKGPDNPEAQRARTPQRAAGIAQRQSSPADAMALPDSQTHGSTSGRWLLLVLLGLGAAGVYLSLNDGWPYRAIDALQAQSSTPADQPQAIHAPSEPALNAAAAMLEAGPIAEQAVVNQIDAAMHRTTPSPKALVPNPVPPVAVASAPAVQPTVVETALPTPATPTPQAISTTPAIDSLSTPSVSTDPTPKVAPITSTSPVIDTATSLTHATNAINPAPALPPSGVAAPVATLGTVPVTTPAPTPPATVTPAAPIASPAPSGPVTVAAATAVAVTAATTAQSNTSAPSAQDILAVAPQNPNSSVASDTPKEDIVLSFPEECWVEWRLKDGQALQRIYKPGEQLRLPVDQVQRLVLGNARSIQAQVGTQPLDLGLFIRGAGTVARIDGSALLEAIR